MSSTTTANNSVMSYTATANTTENA
jgi:hypothetical protein